MSVSSNNNAARAVVEGALFTHQRYNARRLPTCALADVVVAARSRRLFFLPASAAAGVLDSVPVSLLGPRFARRRRWVHGVGRLRGFCPGALLFQVTCIASAAQGVFLCLTTLRWWMMVDSARKSLITTQFRTERSTLQKSKAVPLFRGCLLWIPQKLLELVMLHLQVPFYARGNTLSQ